MSIAEFTYSAAEVRRVKRMQFGVLSPEEIVSIQENDDDNDPPCTKICSSRFRWY